jgi:hypothetical protein
VIWEPVHLLTLSIVACHFLSVTFETEAAQRHVLSSLSVGSAKAAANDVKGIDPNHLFRGKYVLDVREADEASKLPQLWHCQCSCNFSHVFWLQPNTVRWQDLNAGVSTAILYLLKRCLCRRGF